MPKKIEVGLEPAEVEGKSFSSGFRGYDQTEVRQYLRSISVAMKGQQSARSQLEADVENLQSSVERLEAELDSSRSDYVKLVDTPSPVDPEPMAGLDEDDLTRLLGEETARVLTSARRAAAEIEEGAEARAAESLKTSEDLLNQARTDSTEVSEKAAQEATRVTQEATDQADLTRKEAEESATEMRTEAEQLLEVRTQEAQGAADEITQTAQEVATAVRAEAAGDSEAAADAAREHARQMLVEAQSVREKVLSDLIIKRRVARQQLDGIRAARDRLARSLFDIRQHIEGSVTELQLSIPEARLAMETFTRRDDSSTDQADVAKLATALDDGDSVAKGAAQKQEPSSPKRESDQEEEQSDPDDHSIEALFAQMREPEDSEVGVKEDETEEAKIEDVDVEAEGEPDDHDRPGQESPAVGVEASATNEPRPEFVSRDVAMTRLGPDVRRLIKRAFADDLSDVLDRIRSGSGGLAVDELAPAEKLAAAVRDALSGGLAKAAQFGSEVVGGGRPAGVGSLVDELTDNLVGPFRARLEAVIVRPDADRDELAEPLRSLYRGVRTNDLVSTADDGLALAFALGLYESIDDESSVRWVTDPRAETSAECHDNTLAGAVTKGEEFPTGHRLPSNEHGCRCLVLPA